MRSEWPSHRYRSQSPGRLCPSKQYSCKSIASGRGASRGSPDSGAERPPQCVLPRSPIGLWSLQVSFVFRSALVAVFYPHSDATAHNQVTLLFSPPAHDILSTGETRCMRCSCVRLPSPPLVHLLAGLLCISGAMPSFSQAGVAPSVKNVDGRAVASIVSSQPPPVNPSSSGAD